MSEKRKRKIIEKVYKNKFGRNISRDSTNINYRGNMKLVIERFYSGAA